MTHSFDRHAVGPVLVEICHRLYAKGLVTATDGNVSVRCENGHILTTRSGINKGMVTESDLVEVTLDGMQIAGKGKPSTEIGMHLFIYSKRADIRAVVHAHPTYATGFATARIPLDACLFPEVIVGMGSIPLAVYATPSTRNVADSLAPYVDDHDAVLLSNHGVVCYGEDLYSAFFKMEKVEHAAHITFVARMMGGEQLLSRTDLESLKAVSKQSYGRDLRESTMCTTGEMTEQELREHVRRSLERFGIR